MARLFFADLFSRHQAALQAADRALTGTMEVTATLLARGDRTQRLRMPLRGRSSLSCRLTTPLQLGARAGSVSVALRCDVNVQILRGGRPELSASDRLDPMARLTYQAMRPGQIQALRHGRLSGRHQFEVGLDLHRSRPSRWWELRDGLRA